MAPRKSRKPTQNQILREHIAQLEGRIRDLEERVARLEREPKKNPNPWPNPYPIVPLPLPAAPDGGGYPWRQPYKPCYGDQPHWRDNTTIICQTGQ